MSLRASYLESKEILMPYMKPVVKAGILFQSGALLEAVSETFFKRKMLPGPLDFPSHIGNFREAAMVTVGAYAAFGLLTFTEPLLDKARDVFRRNAQRATVGAFAVSSAVQIIGEKYGLTTNLVAPNTGDVLDAVYGIGWSAVSALAAYHMTTRLEQDHAERQQPSAQYDADSVPVSLNHDYQAFDMTTH